MRCDVYDAVVFIFSDVAAEMCLCFECLCLNVGLN